MVLSGHSHSIIEKKYQKKKLSIYTEKTMSRFPDSKIFYMAIYQNKSAEVHTRVRSCHVNIFSRKKKNIVCLYLGLEYDCAISLDID